MVTVTINVAPDANAPDAVNDNINVPYNAQVTFNPMANDIEGVVITSITANSVTTTLQYPSTVSLTNGTLFVISPTNFAFSPNSGFSGVQTFDYVLSSGSQSDTATVTFTVAANNANTAPVAKNDSFTTVEDTVFSGNVISGASPSAGDDDFDPDNDPLTTVLLTQPTGGAVSMLGDGSFTFTPNANFNGDAVFTYRLLDGRGGLATGTVTVSVTQVNDAPVVTSATFTVPENSVGGTVVGQVVASDVDAGQTLTYSIEGSTPAETASLNNQFEITSTGEIRVKTVLLRVC